MFFIKFHFIVFGIFEVISLFPFRRFGWILADFGLSWVALHARGRVLLARAVVRACRATTFVGGPRPGTPKDCLGTGMAHRHRAAPPIGLAEVLAQ